MFFFRFAFARITSENTCLLRDVTFLELVDLDPTPMNRIVNIYYPQRKEYLKCPHHIITKIVNIAKNFIDASQVGNNIEPHGDTRHLTYKNKSGSVEKEQTFMENILSSHQEMLSLLNGMREKIEKLETKIETLQSVKG